MSKEIIEQNPTSTDFVASVEISGTLNAWMPEARQLAAQCWCDDETKDRVMDTELAEAVAKRIAAWMDAAAQAYRDADYYRGLIVRCGETIGANAYIADDGSRSQDVLCAKVPELVEQLAKRASLISTETTQPQASGETKDFESILRSPSLEQRAESSAKLQRKQQTENTTKLT